MFDERRQRLSDDMSLLAEGEINPLQLGLRAAGEAVGGLGDVAAPVMEAVIPDFVQEGISQVVQGVMETGPAKAALAWMEENPEAARDIVSGLNVASLIPGGAAARVGKKMRGYGDEALKGGGIASASNYIPNWYGPDRAPNFVEKAAGNALERTGKVSGEQGTAAAMKATGAAQWGAQGLLGALEGVVSPKARALYGETGATRAGQRHVAGEIAKQDTPLMKWDGTEGKYTRGPEKGVAQVIYGSHIGNQAGRKGATAPVIDDIMNRSTLQQATDLTPENLSQSLQQQAWKVDPENPTRAKKLDHNDPYWRTARSEVMEAKDADFVTKYLFQKQKPNASAQFVIKNPTARESGGHFSDVVHKNPANEAVADVFAKHADADGNVDLQTLYKELESRKGTFNDKLKKAGRRRDGWSVVNSSPEHVAENGLWLAGGKGGSAVTEGGVMWLQKLDPDGTTTTFMIDKHDFLEKGGKANPINSLLPNDMIAITPPMKGNIKSQRKVKRKYKRGEKAVELKAPEWYQQAGKDQANWKGADLMKEGGLLDQYANLQPSQQAVTGERLRTAGGASQLAALLAMGQQDDK